jgi:MraZ protein
MDHANTFNQAAEPAYTFHGDYTRAVDAKGRFNLPFRFRQGGSGPGDEKYVVARGADGSLAIHPHDVWLAIFQRMRQGEPGPKLRANLRAMSLGSKVIEPDAQGRVQVPVEMLGTVGITAKVTVVGMGSYMELWSPESLADRMAGTDGPDAGFMDDFYR